MFYSGEDLASWATRFIQSSIERNLPKGYFETVLEIGGGEGFHLEHLKHEFNLYYLTDVQLRDLTPYAQDLRKSGRLNYVRANARNLPFDSETFDRTVIMCVLHHLGGVEKVLREAHRVTKPNGLISIYLPCDPGMLYRILRKVFTRGKARKLKIDYDYVNAMEHFGSFASINTLIKRVFCDDKVKIIRFPFGIPSWNLNIFYTYQIIRKLD